MLLPRPFRPRSSRSEHASRAAMNFPAKPSSPSPSMDAMSRWPHSLSKRKSRCSCGASRSLCAKSTARFPPNAPSVPARFTAWRSMAHPLAPNSNCRWNSRRSPANCWSTFTTAIHRRWPLMACRPSSTRSICSSWLRPPAASRCSRAIRKPRLHATISPPSPARCATPTPPFSHRARSNPCRITARASRSAPHR